MFAHLADLTVSAFKKLHRKHGVIGFSGYNGNTRRLCDVTVNIHGFSERFDLFRIHFALDLDMIDLGFMVFRMHQAVASSGWQARRHW